MFQLEGGLTHEAHDRPWGIYSGYSRDPDGHLWEVMWNPQLDATDRASVSPEQ
jgi:hypothetical protein